MKTILDEFMEYVNNATPEQLKEDWEELKQYCNVGKPILEVLDDQYIYMVTHKTTINPPCVYPSIESIQIGAERYLAA